MRDANEVDAVEVRLLSVALEMKVKPMQTVLIAERLLADSREMQVKPMQTVLLGVRLRVDAEEMQAKPVPTVLVGVRLRAFSIISASVPVFCIGFALSRVECGVRLRPPHSHGCFEAMLCVSRVASPRSTRV